MSKTVSKSQLVKTKLYLCQQICGICLNCEKNGNLKQGFGAVWRIFLRDRPISCLGGNSEFAFEIKAEV
jgi:hypothetical protein